MLSHDYCTSIWYKARLILLCNLIFYVLCENILVEFSSYVYLSNQGNNDLRESTNI